ncbi:MAG: hypothetical protein Q7R33_04755 [Nitrosarchaeum sp.]|nr:hypothetical protein [Nitrosarchaeum sp.]
MIFFTADTHFNHQNIIQYCQRPFAANATEMNETLISNWNAVVQRSDLVYHIGDFGFGDLSQILPRLNGQKILILGDHDKSAIKFSQYFAKITPLLKIEVDVNTVWRKITLCHYSMRVWAKSHYNEWHLFGHSHGHLEPFGKSFDVGVDYNNFRPISLTQVVEKMSTLPDNFNCLPQFKGR